MKISFKLLVTLLVLSSFFTGCKKENVCDCFKGTGKEVTIVRNISGFNKIDVLDKVEVHIVEDTVFSVEIVGGKNVVGLIKTTLENGALKIRNDNKCNFMRSYKKKITVNIKMPVVRWIVHRGLGTIYVDNEVTSDTVTYQIFNSGDLHLKVNNNTVIGGVNGMGDAYLSGTTNKHLTNINGESFLQAENLVTNISDLYLKTSGLSYINVTGQLNIVLEQSGDLYYKGSPSVIQQNITGTGKLIPY